MRNKKALGFARLRLENTEQYFINFVHFLGLLQTNSELLVFELNK